MVFTEDRHIEIEYAVQGIELESSCTIRSKNQKIKLKKTKVREVAMLPSSNSYRELEVPREKGLDRQTDPVTDSKTVVLLSIL